jgi:glycerophosphoryl diester phosphodiesterase
VADIGVLVVLVVLVALLAYWAGPMWRGRPLPGVKRPSPWLVGHRGTIGPVRENTMAAFEHALAAGVDGLETDVQRTRDGGLVLVHDLEVGGRRVTAMTAAQLAESAPDLATLNELITLVRAHPGTLLNVELKSDGRGAGTLARAVAQALRACGLADRLVVSSFDPLALLALRLAAPELRTAYLWWPGERAPRLLRSPWPARWLHVDALHPHYRAVDEALVGRARRRSLLVNVWTVNDVAEARRLRGLGVSGIISDDPKLFDRVEIGDGA